MLNLSWYEWMVIFILSGIVIYVKIRFINVWNQRQEKKKDVERDKWGDEK